MANTDEQRSDGKTLRIKGISMGIGRGAHPGACGRGWEVGGEGEVALVGGGGASTRAGVGGEGASTGARRGLGFGGDEGEERVGIWGRKQRGKKQRVGILGVKSA